MIPAGPEYRLLLLCAGVKSEAYRDMRWQEALSLVTDGRRLLRAALRHGVFPSLCRGLSRAPAPALPPGFLQEIQTLCRAQAQRNLRITGELLRLLALLTEHGVTALPFKGPVLAQVAYGDVSRRQFVDLDLLVRRADIPKVKNLLLSLGYRLDHAYTPRQEEAHLRHTCEFSFYHPRKTLVDVHWRFAARYLGGGPDAHRAFARRTTVNLLGKTVFTLSPVDHLLVLCHHGSFHLWWHLSLISDVAHLLKSQPHWDWEALLREAAAGRMRRMVLLGLSLAHGVLGAPAPRHLIAQAEADRVVARLHRQVCLRLFSPGEPEPGLLAGSLFQWRTREHLRDRLAYVLIRAFLPTVQDWHWKPLPDSNYWRYYLLRPWRLCQAGVLPLFKHRGSQPA